jgi:hypothetical protein
MIRVIKGATGGTYPFPIDPAKASEETAYHVLIKSGWTPRNISSDEKFAINGRLRSLEPNELKALDTTRKQMLKSELSKLNRDAIDQAYEELGEEVADFRFSQALGALGRMINKAALAKVANAVSQNAEDYEAEQPATPQPAPQADWQSAPIADADNPYLQ